MNRYTVTNIKSSVVAIGLIDANSNPIVVGGSGFVIHPEEYIVTASHVLTDLEKTQKQLLEYRNLKTFMTIFDFQEEADGFRVINAPVGKAKLLKLKTNQDLPGFDLDIALLRPKEQKDNHKFLTLSNRTKYSVLEEIYVCGYPGGDFSYKISGHPVEISLSPVIQIGRIAALKPSDNAPNHQGIITDIIGVGGSIGSPILDANSGEVIGIVQNVIPGQLYECKAMYTQRLYSLNSETNDLIEKEVKTDGPAYGPVNIGLMYGLSNIMFKQVGKYAKEILDSDKQIPENVTNYTTMQVEQIV